MKKESIDLVEYTIKLEHDNIYLKQRNIKLKTKLRLKNRELSSHKDTINHLNNELSELNRIISLYENSTSWKITKSIRVLGRISRIAKLVTRKVVQDPKLISKGYSAYKKYGITHVFNKIKSFSNPVYINTGREPIDITKQKNVYILTTKHCFFIANLIKSNLSKIGISSTIIFEEPKNGFGKGVHFVICAQMFEKLPDTYIAFQLEQSVNSRWFTERYLTVLENSYAILDYNLDNIQYLQEQGLYYNQMYYMPIAFHNNYYVNDVKEEYDVLFYGDLNNERRKKYISELSKHFKVKVVSEVFAEDLYKELAKAKVIVNIHYYEGALLETTRLFECLSLNKLVVSETSSDSDRYPELKYCVDLVEIDNISAMIDRVSYWLHNEEKRRRKIEENKKYLANYSNWFEYYFLRFMLAHDWLDFDTFYSLVNKHIQFSSDFVCLSLPETVARSKDFDKDNLFGIEKFPALRHSKGWIGCGMSYKFLLRKAKDLRLANITICEDDVEFKDNFDKNYHEIKSYLRTQKDWDIFSGLIADFNGQTNVLSIESTKNREFIKIDKMTSMVMNIYSDKFYDKLLSWDERNFNVEKNAIDRFIESNSGCQTITTNPYLVGHKEDLNSTLWGAKNDIYSEMIKVSEKKLAEKIEEYRKHHK